jgi:nicotinate-nucleotide pyrophosphorylase (carboxylating)
VVLGGERTALDFLMVLSGIATESARWRAAADAASRAAGLTDRLVVTDTRKTLPGLRAASKYAVAVGGAANHRAGLWDMVLIKDNHLRMAGGVTSAVEAARRHHPGLRIQVEADSLEQAVEAVEAGADLVLLDNMDDDGLAAAVAAVREASSGTSRPCLTEASGGVTIERLPALAATGVDRVSTSRLTMARPVDVALDAEDATP